MQGEKQAAELRLLMGKWHVQLRVQPDQSTGICLVRQVSLNYHTPAIAMQEGKYDNRYEHLTISI